MKWLYRIFRLFRCAHRRQLYGQTKIMNGEIAVGHIYFNRCSRCGDIKQVQT